MTQEPQWIIRRTAELVRQGVHQTLAHAQAVAEYKAGVGLRKPEAGK